MHFNITFEELCPVLPHLYRTDWLPPWQRMATLYPEGRSYPYHRGMITPNPFSFRNIYSAIIAWLSHRLRIFSDFNIKAAFCQFFNNGFHLPFFIKIVFICCEKYKSQHIFITFYNIVLTVKTPLSQCGSSLQAWRRKTYRQSCRAVGWRDWYFRKRRTAH